MTKEEHSIPGELVIAERVTTNDFEPQKARRVVALLALSVAMMMTGAGIIMPIFARRLSEFGDGVEALGLLTTTFALAHLVAAPFMGALADRYGRRLLILVSLVAFTLANIGYLFAGSTAMLIVTRTLGGLFTAGLFPAAMGVVGDVFTDEQRSRWVGIVMAAYGVGYIFGPALGGFLYDAWGYSSPFILSASAGLLAFLAALIWVPETRPATVRHRENLRRVRQERIHQLPRERIRDSLPRPLQVFVVLLLIDFIGSFAFAFIEPQMIFYMYDELQWNTSSFGILVGVYGLAMVLGQVGLGNLSDRWGRKTVILLGLVLSVTLYIGISLTTHFPTLIVICAIAGLGAALTAPALSAFFLDITPDRSRSRVLGIKESVLSSGSAAGPLLVAAATRFLDSIGIFVLGGVMVVLSVVLTALFLKEPKHSAVMPVDEDWQIAARRSLAAQSAMRGIVLQAEAVRADQAGRFIRESMEKARKFRDKSSGGER